MALLRRESRSAEPYDVFSRFDRMFDEWTKAFPFRGTLASRVPATVGDDDVIRVDEFRDADTLVVRAEVPGVDPDKDVSVTVSDDMLRIQARREVEERHESGGYVRRELRSGAMTRTLPLPEGVAESDITASYTDGILEVRVPVPQVPSTQEPKQIPVARS